jgi:hypothetical protein
VWKKRSTPREVSTMTAHEYVKAIRAILAGSRYECEVWVDALHAQNAYRFRVAEHYDVQAFATAEEAIAAANRWASEQTVAERTKPRVSLPPG